jgi:F0F1-type ATP synthase assembly protein I
LTQRRKKPYNFQVCLAPVSISQSDRPPGFPIRRVATWQGIAALLIAAIAGWLAGWHGVLSAVLGGVVNIAAGVVFAVLISLDRSASAAATVRTMLRAEAAKIAVIVLQLWLILTTYRDVVHAAFFSAFVVTVLVSQAAILVRD